MRFYPFVHNKEHEKVEIEISDATAEDFLITEQDPRWQSSWAQAQKLSGNCYAFKTTSGELIALGRYENKDKALYVHIAYIEAQALSNPTLVDVDAKKYFDIGQLLIAFGIKLSIDFGYGGDIAFEAKTDELASYYKQKFHATELNHIPGEARRFMLAGDEAWDIFSYYLH